MFFNRTICVLVFNVMIGGPSLCAMQDGLARSFTDFESVMRSNACGIQVQPHLTALVLKLSDVVHAYQASPSASMAYFIQGEFLWVSVFV